MKGLNEDKADMTPAVSSAFDKLFAYVEIQWICNTKIPPIRMVSVFDKCKNNNEVENWNVVRVYPVTRWTSLIKFFS